MAVIHLQLGDTLIVGGLMLTVSEAVEIDPDEPNENDEIKIDVHTKDELQNQLIKTVRWPAEREAANG